MQDAQGGGRAPAGLQGSDGMTDTQVRDLKRLSEIAFEPEAFRPNLTRAEADRRIKALTAKLRLLDEPPHTL